MLTGNRFLIHIISSIFAWPNELYAGFTCATRDVCWPILRKTATDCGMDLSMLFGCLAGLTLREYLWALSLLYISTLLNLAIIIYRRGIHLPESWWYMCLHVSCDPHTFYIFKYLPLVWTFSECTKRTRFSSSSPNNRGSRLLLICIRSQTMITMISSVLCGSSWSPFHTPLIWRQLDLHPTDGQSAPNSFDVKCQCFNSRLLFTYKDTLISPSPHIY